MNKYLISADIEGITGVVTREFSREQGKYHALACRYMASDVNAVIQGIVEMDPEAIIIVRDAHGSAVNLNLELLHSAAQLIQGWDAQQNMLFGLNKDFTGVFLIGYHAGGDNPDAVLAHTMSSVIREIKINGEPVNETGLLALYAGQLGIPVVMVSGDDFAIAEAVQQLGNNIVTVAVKKSYGRSCSSSISLEAAKNQLRKGATEAIVRLRQNIFSPKIVTGRVKCELSLYGIGVGTLIIRNISQLFAHDASYAFNLQSGSIIFESEEIGEILQRISLILFTIYGIRSMS